MSLWLAFLAVFDQSVVSSCRCALTHDYRRMGPMQSETETTDKLGVGRNR